jgi:hypothetical protein
MKTLVCMKDNFPTYCMPEKSLSGVKYRCFVCNHYVKPDKLHKWENEIVWTKKRLRKLSEKV